jgi:hypothetical protein
MTDPDAHQRWLDLTAAVTTEAERADERRLLRGVAWTIAAIPVVIAIVLVGFIQH